MYRHVCENCRCARSDHDVSSDDRSDAYDRLGLTISADPHRSPLQASRDLASKLGYTWIPPALGKQKVLHLSWDFYSAHEEHR